MGWGDFRKGGSEGLFLFKSPNDRWVTLRLADYFSVIDTPKSVQAEQKCM